MSIRNAFEAHDVLSQGLPAPTLLALIDVVGFLGEGDNLKTLFGLSSRTLRWRRGPDDLRTLSIEQSNQVWQFAKVLSHAVDGLGSEAEAERWMNMAATGLSNRKPVDLLANVADFAAVENYLTRIEVGVYM